MKFYTRQLFFIFCLLLPNISFAATVNRDTGTVTLDSTEYASRWTYANKDTGQKQLLQFVYKETTPGKYEITQVYEGKNGSGNQIVDWNDRTSSHTNTLKAYSDYNTATKDDSYSGLDYSRLAGVGGNVGLQNVIAAEYFGKISDDSVKSRADLGDAVTKASAANTDGYQIIKGDNNELSLGKGQIRSGATDPGDEFAQASKVPANLLGLTPTHTNTPASVSAGPTYINDGKKICDINGCKYTLMAPIGSLLGTDGKYIINKNDPRGLCSLLNSWFRIGIALAGMLAVVMIVLGGFQYATTDSLFDKEEGKGKIQNALWGLLLALTTWLIVSTINPALANCTINAKEVKLSAMSTSIANSAFRIVTGVYSEAGSIADQANIDAKYKTITDQWTDADREALLSDDPATSKAAADKWAGIQKQLDTLNNSFASKGGSFSGGSTSRDASWGSPDAGNMNGKTISGRQTYFSPNEKVTDSDTQAGNGAIGRLVEGTAGGKNALGQDLGTGDVVGSAGSVYYPAGTLVEINGIKYVVDDNNLKRNGDGTYVAKNPNVTNNYTVDVFTRNDHYVNTGSDTKRTMTVLYVPTTKVNTAAQLNDIRNNPGKYINR